MGKEMTKVWVFIGLTESGDEVGPYVFSTEPSIWQLQEILKRDWPSEFDIDEEDWIDPHFGYIGMHRLSEERIIDL